MRKIKAAEKRKSPLADAELVINFQSLGAFIVEVVEAFEVAHAHLKFRGDNPEVIPLLHCVELRGAIDAAWLFLTAGHFELLANFGCLGVLLFI